MKKVIGVFYLWLASVSSGAGEPTLFYLDKSKPNQCTAYTTKAPFRQRLKQFETKECAETVIWHDNQFYVFIEKEVWVFPGEGRSGKRLTLLPSDPAYTTIFWIEKGQLHVISGYERKESDIQKTPRAFLFGGKSYPAEKVSADGVPFVFVTYVWRDHKWNLVEAAASNWESGDSLGPSVLQTYQTRKPEGHDFTARAGEYGCLGSTLKCTEDIKRPKGFTGEAESYGELSLGKGRRAVFGVAMGDTPHPYAPLFLAQGEGNKLTPLPIGKDRQLGLGQSHDYLLVGTEGTMENPRVFDIATGKPVWGESHFRYAFWVDR